MFFFIIVSTLEFMLIGFISFINYKQLHLIHVITNKLNDINLDIPMLGSDEESENENEESESEENENEESENEESETKQPEFIEISETDVNVNEEVLNDVNILKHIFQQNHDYGNVIESLTKMLEDDSKKNKIL